MMRVVEYDPQRPRYGPRLTNEEWERFRPILTELDRLGLPRQEIVNRARDEHGFRGTYAALNTRFKAWGLTNSDHDHVAQPQTVESDASEIQSGEADQNTVEGRETAVVENRGSKIRRLLSDDTGDSNDTLRADDISTDTVDVHSSASLAQPEATSHELLVPATTDDKIIITSGSEKHESSVASVPQRPKESLDAKATEQSYIDILEVVKRTRSEVSSLRSSKFSLSSDTRSFLRLAKRLRENPPKISSTSLLSLMSSTSSHPSENFGKVSGLHHELPAIQEENKDKNLAAEKEAWRQFIDRPRIVQKKLAHPLSSSLKATLTMNMYRDTDKRIFTDPESRAVHQKTEPKWISSCSMDVRSFVESELLHEATYGKFSSKSMVSRSNFVQYGHLDKDVRKNIRSALFTLFQREHLSSTIHRWNFLAWIEISGNVRESDLDNFETEKAWQPHRYAFRTRSIYVYCKRRGVSLTPLRVFRLDPTILKVWPATLRREPTEDMQRRFDAMYNWPFVGGS